MEKKCRSCNKFNQTGLGSPGRNVGYCQHFDSDEKLPFFVNKNERVRQNVGVDCETFEPIKLTNHKGEWKQ